MWPKTGVFSEPIDEFVAVAERLMLYDVEPRKLTATDIEAIRYCVQSISEKFLSPPLGRVRATNGDLRNGSTP